jgi:hypothetical protein
MQVCKKLMNSVVQTSFCIRRRCRSLLCCYVFMCGSSIIRRVSMGVYVYVCMCVCVCVYVFMCGSSIIRIYVGPYSIQHTAYSIQHIGRIGVTSAHFMYI